MNPSAKNDTASQQIDAIIKKSGDWRGKLLTRLRSVIKKVDPTAVGANPTATISALSEMVAEGITGIVPDAEL
jgi:hypothetical protein